MLGTVLVLLPDVVVDHDLAGASVAAQDRLKAVNDVRTTLLQAVGGMVVLFGAYATWRQLRVSQEGLRATQEGQVTDRFTSAVDQLGSDKLETRIGGLHALWRIAEHSARDREAVLSIQAAYLRTHLPWPSTGPEAPAPDVPINDVVPLEVRAADAQVALTGLGVLLQQPREQSWAGPAAFWRTCGAPGWSKPTCATRTSPRPTCARRTCARPTRAARSSAERTCACPTSAART